MEVKINTTVTFENLLESKHRVTQHIGGTRSGKTYAILQYLIVKAIESTQTITIVRKTIPSLKRTVMKDFSDILKSLNIFREDDFNITDRIWRYGDSIIQFVSTDDAEKLRGIKSSILFLEECSEIDEESAFQLMIRTTGQIIMALNPTVSPYHWVRQMKDCERFVTTYKDNPFLEESVVKAIEDLQHTNQKKWLIYGKGEYAPNDKAIFQFETCGHFESDFVGFGIDFGFSNDPTALVAVYRTGDRIYLEEHLYEKGLVTSDIADRLRKLDITKSEEIWADSAEPRLIEELYRMGFNIKPVTKGKDSIKFGINVMNNYKIFVHNKSQNLINELYSYQYATDKYGYVTDTPEGGLDHLIDAARYCCMMKLSQKAVNKGQYSISIR